MSSINSRKEPFKLETAITQLPGKIDCIEINGENQLLVATNEGSLVVYTTDRSGASMKLSSTRRNFTRKSVVQMCAIEELGVLLVLSGDGPIAVYDLDGFGLRGALERTKGCNVFTVDRTNPNAVVLCAAVKKKVVIYHWSPSTRKFEEHREVPIPDLARTLVWADGYILVGTKREYVLVRANSGAVNTLFSPAKPGSSIYAARLGDTLLALRDNVGVFLNLEGGAAREHGITWSEVPSEFVSARPYVLAVVNKGVEVRVSASSSSSSSSSPSNGGGSIGNGSGFVGGGSGGSVGGSSNSGGGGGGGLTYSQLVPLRDVRMLVAKNFGGASTADAEGPMNVVYAATTSSVHRLVQTPVREQVRCFVRDRNFETALGLCECLPEVSAATGERVRETMTRYVNVQHAYDYFATGQYRASLETFARLQYDPCAVLMLYRTLLPQALAERCDPPPIKLLGLPPGSEEAALRALEGYLQHMRPLVCTDEALARARAGGADRAEYRRCADVATAFDTTLLRVCVQLKDDKHISELVSSPNACHIKEAAEMLAGEKPHLIKFYETKGMHEDALAKLTENNSDLPLTVAYLCKLGPEHKDIILKYARKVLDRDKDKAFFDRDSDLGLQIFLNRDPDHDIDHAAVYRLLKKDYPKYVTCYLEYVVNDAHDPAEEFHSALATQYLDKAKEYLDRAVREGKRDPAQRILAREEDGLLGNARRQLIDFLERSNNYRPETFLTGQKVPECFCEERAILVSKVGNHDAALKIYVRELNSPEMAEEYCRKHYDPAKDDAKDVYMSLLQVYLSSDPSAAAAAAQQSPSPSPLPSSSSSSSAHDRMIKPALEVLSKHYQNIDISKALGLLPVETQLADLMPFFTRVLNETATKRRDGQVVRALLRAESLRVREESIIARSPYIPMDSNTLCASCEKPIRSSAFARLPDGKIVHLMCLQKTRRLSKHDSSGFGTITTTTTPSLTPSYYK